MKKILVVVDMQNDFIDGPLGTPEARAIIDNVCAKIRENKWHKVYVTMDSHCIGNWDRKQEGIRLPVKHCIKRTKGWELNSEVWKAVNSLFDIFEYDSAPGYVCKDTFGSTGLVDRYAKDFGIRDESDTEVTLIGVCTDICVISNALLLKAHYPEMKIVVDAACCAGTTPAKHRMALEVMKSCQVDVVNDDWGDGWVLSRNGWSESKESED